MRDTYVTIERPEHTVLATNVHVQVDQMGDREVAALRAAWEYQAGDYFRIYTADWDPNSLIRRDDVLVDQMFIDPDTITASNPGGNYFRYRIVGRVKDFEYDHQEAYGWVVVGG